MINSINDAFGMNFQMEILNKIKGLPVYMTVGRSFYKAYDDASSFILVKLSDSEKFGVVALDKQKTQYEEKLNLPIVYWFEELTRTQRDSLIGHHIPFVADNLQLYLPFLGIAIQNNFKQKKATKTDKMMPITQSLFLYLLYDCKEKKIMKKQAAEFLGVTRTSITRASEQLEAMGLISQEMVGKEYYMWTNFTGYELYRKAKEYLINPVQESFVTEEKDIKDMILAGDSALAEYSMLNPSNVKSYAIDKTVSRSVTFVKLDEKWEVSRPLIRLELWKYNPALFSINGKVDPVSLYMSMADTEDERVEGELEEMMEEFKW